MSAISRNVQPFLLAHLRQAVRQLADELRFVCGQQPAIRVAGRLLPCGDVPTSAELVQAMHESLMAGLPGGPLAAASDYAVVLPELGTFQCHFEAQGETRTLSIRPESREAELLGVAPRATPPALGTDVGDGG